MKMTNTTFKTRHELPMDKITYDTINKHNESIKQIIRNDWSAESRFILLPCDISYDEDLQIATFNNYGFPFSLEQTPDYFIITMCRFDVFSQYYFINKKTGECSRHKPDSISPSQLVDGLVRVYGKTEDELMETDFISDKLKPYLQRLIWEREYEDAEDDDNPDPLDL